MAFVSRSHKENVFDQKPENPGPGSYNPMYTTTKSFNLQLYPHISNEKSTTNTMTPGPGEYIVDKEQNFED